MKTSLKSFAAFVVTIGISAAGTADLAFAGGNGSHGVSHASSSHPGSGSSRSQESRSSHQFDKHDSHKYDHYWDKDRYGRSYYGYCPSYFSYSNYCYPCYTPSFCCEYAPPCRECCPPVCYQEPCYQYCPQPCCPSCPEYCGNYCFSGYYGKDYYRPRYDRYSDRYKDRDEFKRHQDSSKLSHEGRNNKSSFSGGPKGNSGMGKLASHTSGMSRGSHGSRG